MAEVTAATAAVDFHPAHAVAEIHFLRHVVVVQRGMEARPAAARIELGAGIEQIGAATGTLVDAVALVVEVLAAEGRLGAALPADMKLFRGEFFLPVHA